MKKLTSLLVFVTLSFFLSWHPSTGHTITQSNFNSVITPKYMASGNTTRLPVMFRATVKGLAANTTYRYFIQGALSSDFGTANSAGLSLLVTGSSYSFISSPNTASVGGYATFTTNGSGQYTGWFGLIHDGNSRFSASKTIYPVIVIGSNSTGSVVSRKALNLGIKVLTFSTHHGANKGSFLQEDHSDGAPLDLALLYDNEHGSGRPLYISPIEGIGLVIPNIIPGYTNSSGGWNAIIPNGESDGYYRAINDGDDNGGVKRIEERSVITGNIVCPGYSTDHNGIWHGVNTNSPNNGTSPLVIHSYSALVNLSALVFTRDARCNGASNGSALVIPNGGAGGYSYSWAPYGGWSALATGLAAGSYTCTITDKAGCVLNQTVTIGQPSEMESTVSDIPVSCYEGSDGSATVNVSGGTPPYTYKWLPIGGTGSTATGLSVGIYTCTIKDANRCIHTQTVSISQPGLINVSAEGNASVCLGNAASLFAIADGGTGLLSYHWMPGDMSGSNVVVYPSETTTYTVTATDENGCTGSTAVLVVVNSLPNVAASADPSTMDAGTFSTLSASGAVSYSWSPGDLVGKPVTVILTSSETYTVTGTDENGCSNTATVSITVPPHGPETTKLTDEFCGVQLDDLSTRIYCDPVPDATQYEYHFTDVSTGDIDTFIRVGALNYFYFYMVPQFTYDKTLEIQVRPYVNGEWGTFGSVCILQTPPFPQTQLRSDFCGVTLSSMGTQLFCDPIINVTNYEYEFTDILTNDVFTKLRGNNSNNLYLYWIPEITYDKTYSVRVRAFSNGVWSSFGQPCLITTPEFPITKLSDAFCGASIDMGTQVFIDYLYSVSDYEYEFTDVSTSNVFTTLRGSGYNNFYLYWEPLVHYDKTYNVRVRAFFGGVWGPYGPSCTLTTLGIPPTQLRSDFCGITVSSLGTELYLDPVVNVSNYEYEFTDVLTADVFTKLRGNASSNFYLYTVPEITYGKIYNVRIRAYSNGVWGPYGPACSVTTPSSERIAENAVKEDELGENLNSLKVSVFPNPTSGTAIVKTGSVADKIIVCDVLGKVVNEIKPDLDSYSINFIDQENGLYFIKVVLNDQQVVVRVLLSK
ncbi:MAG: T9SS type A sorting domain-containing protein [Bacteroidota bacterium]|nr:T9SS type A sorting domain-containing protein [Bacteroidota bacterium]